MSIAKTSRPYVAGHRGRAGGATRDENVTGLGSRYEPRRIYKWGPLLDRRAFSAMSDIYIVIEGISEPAGLFALMARRPA
jgi:hypothetical protein